MSDYQKVWREFERNEVTHSAAQYLLAVAASPRRAATRERSTSRVCSTCHGPRIPDPAAYASPTVHLRPRLRAGGARVRRLRPGPVHHRLVIDPTPATHRLVVSDEIQLPPGTDTTRGFLLGATLVIASATPPVEEVPLGDTTPVFGNNGTSGALDPKLVKRYRFTAAPSNGRVRLEYAGPIAFELSAQKEEYTRGFRETVGRDAPEGAYLAGRSYWYPQFGDDLVTFEIDARVPEGWHLVSQGEGTSRDEQGRARWKTSAPMDEIYLFGGPLRAWRDRAGAVESLVYLRQDDPALASKYLAATAQYIEMYRALIGTGPWQYRTCPAWQ